MSVSVLSSRRPRRLVVGATALAVVAGTASGAGAATSHHGAAAHVRMRVQYSVNKPLCPTRAKPGQVTCFAIRKVPVRAGTRGAQRTAIPASIGLGPMGGYTPDDLAAAYQYNPKTPRPGQIVGIVDWYDDPNITKDLNKFDAHYGLKKETATSFRKLNQVGKKSPLPSSQKGKESSGEISLDVETVRGVCNTCKILLIEANSPHDSDIIKAENTAAALGATEITNSFGGTEGGEGPAILNAFNHPGIVITASTGDDGWYDWDFANRGPGNPSSEAPEYPAADPHVVAVGGTELALDPNGTRLEEAVWNENGASDSIGQSQGADQGAGGGGCSKEFTAAPWQSTYPGYSSAGCSGKRLEADVSALADPQTGFSVYDSWGDNGWSVVGGTSLSSPLVAAMWALAGGSGGAAYPAQSLYNNAQVHPASVFDVTSGGNGFCGGDSTSICGNNVFSDSSGATHNPNALGHGNVDCSFPRNTNDPAVPPALSKECNAVVGFDGPTGVGTPNGTGLFTSTSPTVSLRTPKKLSLHKPASFTANATDQLPGATITNYSFSWGDGANSASPSAQASHTYLKAGIYPVVLVVSDDADQNSVVTRYLIVGKDLKLNLFGPTSLVHGHTGHFRAKGIDINTGGKITKVKWGWGDGHHSTGKKASHAWKHAGKYTIHITLKDNTGVVSGFTAKQRVT